LAILSACALLAGCANPNQKKIDQAVNDYFIGNYEQARQILRPLANEQNQDFVLNNLRLASVCLTDYHLIEAEAAFLRAYEVINAVGVNEGGRSWWMRRSRSGRVSRSSGRWPISTWG
jgi:hypothetical protein